MKYNYLPEENVENVISFLREVTITVEGKWSEKGWLCHRRDFHDDGSKSDYYYVEITEPQFNELSDAIGLVGISKAPDEA